MSGVFAPFAWNKLWRRELFNEGNRFPPGRYFEDLSTTWKLFNQCHRVTCVPDVLFHYLVRREGISNTKNMKNLVDYWLAAKERYDEMAAKGDDIQRICMRDCLETIGYTWRWLYGVEKKEREEHWKAVHDMRTFLKANSDMVGLCSSATRISLFCARHSNSVTEWGCYNLNRIYRKIRGMDQMV